jgi:hypothetical protein
MPQGEAHIQAQSAIASCENALWCVALKFWLHLSGCDIQVPQSQRELTQHTLQPELYHATCHTQHHDHERDAMSIECVFKSAG